MLVSRGSGEFRVVSRASVITSVQDQWRANLRCRRRAVVMIWAATEEATGLPPAGFAQQGEHGHVCEEVEGDLDDLQPNLVLRGVVQGRLRRPVARAARLQSSARARRRCRSSSAAIGMSVVLVAKQVSRRPSAWVIRNWAPDGAVPCERSAAFPSASP